MIRLSVFSLMAMLPISTTAQSIVDGSGSSIPDELRKAALQKVSDKFKDPVGSEFRRVNLVPNKNDFIELICGQVNSKNSYGAFTGFTFFTYLRLYKGRKEEVEIAPNDFIEKVERKPELVAQYRAAGCLP